MGILGVTEWENLGYHDSDMMGRAGNVDPRSYWRADLDEAAGRLVWLIRRYQPDVVTTYNEFGGYGHPDHIRTHDVAVRAFPRAGDPVWYPEQLTPESGGTGPGIDEGGLEPWSPSKLYEQAMPASVRTAMNEKMQELGLESFWLPPKDATPEQLAEFEAFMAKMLVPDEAITTRIDIAATSSSANGTRSTNTSRRSPPTARSCSSVSTAGASSGRSSPTSCASRASSRRSLRRTCSPGSSSGGRPLPRQVRAAVDPGQDDLAIRGVEEVRLGLVEDDVGTHPHLGEVVAPEVSSRVIPSIV